MCLFEDGTKENAREAPRDEFEMREEMLEKENVKILPSSPLSNSI